MEGEKTIERPLNFREACDFLGVGRTKMYELMNNDLIPFHKPPGLKARFFKSELTDYVRGVQFEGRKSA